MKWELTLEYVDQVVLVHKQDEIGVVPGRDEGGVVPGWDEVGVVEDELGQAAEDNEAGDGDVGLDMLPLPGGQADQQAELALSNLFNSECRRGCQHL